MTKAERKKICGLLDIKRLTMDASMHAAQNELLPLRVVVQVLYFEQVRAASAVQRREDSNSITNAEYEWDKTLPNECNDSLGKQMSRLKLTRDGSQKNGKLSKKGSKNSLSGVQLLRSRSRRIFDRLFVSGKGNGYGENRSSETSGSSPSPTSMIQGETKSSGSSSRHRRNSVS